MKTLWALALILSGCGVASRHPLDISNAKEAWNANNDPINLRDAYTVNFDQLPLQGELSRKPWTDSYWPSYRGGIADRWNDPDAESAFKYTLYDLDDIRRLRPEELVRLSPAEKYDIFMGRYDYPLVHHERWRTNPEDPGWFGLCHGWAPAAINYDEPHAVTLRGANGIDVPFGASDVKALLTFAQQFGNDTRFLGSRCNWRPDQPEFLTAAECRDTNAGSFHVVLTNQIGMLGSSFVADMSRSDQVWNHPIYGFTAAVESRSNEVYPGAAPGTVSIVSLTTQVRFVSELSPSWDPMPLENYPWQASRNTLRYRLELDADDNIIGGEWDSDSRPDFLWTEGKPEFRGFFAAIEAIYAASIAR